MRTLRIFSIYIVISVVLLTTRAQKLPTLKDYKKLSKFLVKEGAKSVVNIGIGNSVLVKTLIDSGILFSSYDANSKIQNISSGSCARADLTKPLRLAKYDWAILHHIPKKFNSIFVSNLDALNKRGIVVYFGVGKKIEKAVMYNAEIIEKFLNLGYMIDTEASTQLVTNNQQRNNYSTFVLRKIENLRQDNLPTINLAVVSCGTRKLEEAITMVKSAVLFSRGSSLRVFAFTDNQSLPLFNQYMKQLLSDSRTVGLAFKYKINLTSFPPEIRGMKSWATVFRPCALQRLFLPRLLPDVDSLIYLDADTLILSNLSDLWNYFKSMNSTQMIGQSPYRENSGKYQFRGKVPQYGVSGLNSGVTLMNLTRMRLAKFEEKIIGVRRNYQHLARPYPCDQFLQTILYSNHPEFVYVLPCEWNLRPYHCLEPRYQIARDLDKRDRCKSALTEGVSLIHGTSGALKSTTALPMFRHIYEILKTYNFRYDNPTALLAKLDAQFQLEESTCYFKSSKIFYKKLKTYFIEQ